MSLPRVVAIAPGSPAARAGLAEGDEILSINGEVPRDLIEWRMLVDEPQVSLELNRGGLESLVEVDKRAGEPLGVEVHSALFDRVRTCDNHCEFCFIYQLPPGLRRSLYLKDDDYRLSFLHGNFTTLTRFTEADLERIVTERLGPLYVSIHATDPDVRSEMLRNRRGATSLRWLRALLDHGIEIHGQVVLCPGVNDGPVLDDTLAGVLDRYPQLATLAVVPLGVSKYNTEARMRPHTTAEAQAVLDAVHDWQDVYRTTLGRRLVLAADEYYLLAARPFPDAADYGDFSMLEDGIGMARAFELELLGRQRLAMRTSPFQESFFSSVDTEYEPYRCDRSAGLVQIRPSHHAPVALLTAPYGARVLEPMLERIGRPDVRVLPVENQFFGGNIAVSGLMVGDDVARVLADEPPGHRYLLPDVCLSQGRFLDGSEPGDLPNPVEIVPADGAGLRTALELGS